MAETDRQRAARLLAKTGDFYWDDLEEEHGIDIVMKYRKFLVLKVMDDDLEVDMKLLRYGPGEEIDAVWHSHMLRPQHYVDVCASLTGSRVSLVEHDPKTAKWINVKERTVRAAKRMQTLFNEVRPAKRRRLRSGNMEIFFIDMKGQNLVFHTNKNDTIEDFKRSVERRTGIRTHLQRLIYNGKDLQDSLTFDALGILTDSTIRLVLRLSGC